MNTNLKPKPSPALTDESTNIFYACAICQSLAPFHVCIITPDKMGICGNYNWRTAKAVCARKPYGPYKPVIKGELIDPERGQWRGVNEYLRKTSYDRVKRVNLYSIIHEPLTACLLCEAITTVLPLCNGVMTINREYQEETPAGMTYRGISAIVRGGEQTPGLMGHAKHYITQENFIKAEGGLLRIVWMPKILKEEIREHFNARARELGVPDLLDKVADEMVGITEESILPFLQEKGHPALTMGPILD